MINDQFIQLEGKFIKKSVIFKRYLKLVNALTTLKQLVETNEHIFKTKEELLGIIEKGLEI
jgi:hypothetical protein